MKVYVAQISPTLGDEEKNIKIMLEEGKKAVEEKADIIVFPELSLTGYRLEELVYDLAREDTPMELLELSKKIGVIYGGIERGSDNFTYNTGYYLEDGRVLSKHRKVYLPTYGLFDEGRYLKRGERIRAFNTKHGRLGLLICEDMWHPSTSYVMAMDSVDYLFVIINSPLQDTISEDEVRRKWETLTTSAATSYGIYVVGVNRCGVEDGVTFSGGSHIVSPNGSVIARGKLIEKDSLVEELPKEEIRRAKDSAPILKTEDPYLTMRELKRITKFKSR